MRALLLTAASIAIMTASFDAEARGRGRGSAASVTRHTTVQGAIVASPARTAPDGNRTDNPTGDNASPVTGPAGTRSLQGAPAAVGKAGNLRYGAPGRKVVASAPVALKEASPSDWCPTKRIAGSGTGFCFVN